MKKKILLMFLSMTIISAFSAYNIISAFELISWQEKIDDSVYESPIYNGGKRIVHIFRTDISEDVIEYDLYNQYGYRVELYEDEVQYERDIKPAIIKQVESKLGVVKAHAVSEKMKLIGEKLTPIDEALNEDYDRYIISKRAIVRKNNLSSVDSFIKTNNINETDVIYKGEYSSSIILRATDAEIEKYAKCKDVEKIYAHEEGILTPMLSTIDDSIDIDSISGTKSSFYNAGAGYRGAGVKIGIIEQLRFNPSNPHLSSISNTMQLQYIENVKNGVILTPGELRSYTPDSNGLYAGVDYENHATIMTTIIVGQAVSYGGELFEGVAPNATVYQTCANDKQSVYNAFNILANEGVTAINFSQGIYDYRNNYSVVDKEIDKMIESSGITFISAAGNFDSDNPNSTLSNIVSPGLAYNAITVGNAITQSYENNSLDIWSNYMIYPDSSYEEASYITSKPDICAPGTSIGFFDLMTGSIRRVTGTSAAAAITTGVIAQIQEDMAIRLNYTRTKAHLLSGATKISQANGYGDVAVDDNDMLYEKSGIGLINAVNSLNTMGMSNYGSVIFNTFAESQVPKILGTKTFTAGDKIRVVMTFNKPEYTSLVSRYRNNVDLFIYDDSSNLLIASSENIYNNVEAVEFIVPSTGRYRIEAELMEHIIPSSNTYLDVVAVWRVID